MRLLRAWRFSAGLAALAVAGAPLSASAQSTPPNVLPGARTQDVELSTEVLYDSNVSAADAAVSSARGLTRGDVIFEPTINFDLARPVGRQTVYLQGTAGYDFYVRNPILNRINLNIRPGILGQFGPCQTTVSGQYIRAQSNLSELAQTPTGLPIVVNQQNVLQVEQISGSANCGRSIGFAPTASASESWVQNSSQTQRFTNSQTFSGSAGLAYRRPSLGSISLFGSYSDTSFPNREALVVFFGPSIAGGYQTYSGGVTYTRAVGHKLQGNASVSYTKLISQSGSSSNFSGVTFSAGLTYQVSSRLIAQAQLSRATVPSTRLNSTYGLDNLYSTQLSYRLSSRLAVSSGASYASDSYNGVPYPVGFDITQERIYTVFGNADYQLNRRFSLGLNVEHLQRNANFPGLSYPETRAGLTARARF